MSSSESSQLSFRVENINYEEGGQSGRDVLSHMNRNSESSIESSHKPSANTATPVPIVRKVEARPPLPQSTVENKEKLKKLIGNVYNKDIKVKKPIPKVISEMNSSGDDFAGQTSHYDETIRQEGEFSRRIKTEGNYQQDPIQTHSSKKLEEKRKSIKLGEYSSLKPAEGLLIKPDFSSSPRPSASYKSNTDYLGEPPLKPEQSGTTNNYNKHNSMIEGLQNKQSNHGRTATLAQYSNTSTTGFRSPTNATQSVRNPFTKTASLSQPFFPKQKPMTNNTLNSPKTNSSVYNNTHVSRPRVFSQQQDMQSVVQRLQRQIQLKQEQKWILADECRLQRQKLLDRIKDLEYKNSVLEKFGERYNAIQQKYQQALLQAYSGNQGLVNKSLASIQNLSSRHDRSSSHLSSVPMSRMESASNISNIDKKLAIIEQQKKQYQKIVYELHKENKRYRTILQQKDLLSKPQYETSTKRLKNIIQNLRKMDIQQDQQE